MPVFVSPSLLNDCAVLGLWASLEISALLPWYLSTFVRTYMIPAATTVWCPFPMQLRSLLDLPTAGFLPRFRRCGPTCQALMVRILSREASANSCAKVMTVACWFSTLVPRLSQKMSVSELLPCIRAQVLHRSIHRSSSLSPMYGEVSSVFSPTSGVTLDFLERASMCSKPSEVSVGHGSWTAVGLQVP